MGSLYDLNSKWLKKENSIQVYLYVFFTESNKHKHDFFNESNKHHKKDNKYGSASIMVA